MTYNDNDIVKALECCSRLNYSDNWKICKNECPYKNNCYDEENGVHFIKDVIALINRQKAEIERLQKENNHFADIGKMYSEIKAEAIKEFAEMLKSNFAGGWLEMDEDWFEKFVKEMVGEDK